MEKNLLCMYSGGLDSAAMLYQVLNDEAYSDHVVHVHHMHLRNVERRAPAEAAAVKNTLAYFKAHYPDRLTYSECTLEYHFMTKGFLFDIEVGAFMSANIASRDKRIVGIVRGQTKSDFDVGGEAYLQRGKRAQDIYDSLMQFEDFKPPFITPLVEMTKEEIWHSIPADLRRLTWSCRRPVYKENKAIPCGQCSPCNEIKEIIKRDHVKNMVTSETT